MIFGTPVSGFEKKAKKSLTVAGDCCPAACWAAVSTGRLNPASLLRNRLRGEPAQPELEVQRVKNYEFVEWEDGTPVQLGRGPIGVTSIAFRNRPLE
jgi:hypothetical protein